MPPKESDPVIVHDSPTTGPVLPPVTTTAMPPDIASTVAEFDPLFSEPPAPVGPPALTTASAVPARTTASKSPQRRASTRASGGAQGNAPKARTSPLSKPPTSLTIPSASSPSSNAFMDNLEIIDRGEIAGYTGSSIVNIIDDDDDAFDSDFDDDNMDPFVDGTSSSNLSAYDADDFVSLERISGLNIAGPGTGPSGNAGASGAGGDEDLMMLDPAMEPTEPSSSSALGTNPSAITIVPSPSSDRQASNSTNPRVPGHFSPPTDTDRGLPPLSSSPPVPTFSGTDDNGVWAPPVTVGPMEGTYAGTLSGTITYPTLPTQKSTGKDNATGGRGFSASIGRAQGATGGESGGGRTRESNLCVICGERPKHRSPSGALFDTCGQSCRATLELVRENAQQNQHYSGRSQASHRNSGAPTIGQDWMMNLQRTQIISTPSAQKMCQVCRERPCYVRNGRVFPTCGMNCAARLAPPGTPLCDFCKQRPKLVLDGKVYPQCGRTCRDKAKEAAALSAKAATCTTCLVCWRIRLPEGSKPLATCSTSCADTLKRIAPNLIEVPKGHLAFQQLLEFFQHRWQNDRHQPPTVKRMCRVNLRPAFSTVYEDYRQSVSSHGIFQKRGNEQRLWIGLVRRCGLGDPGNTEPCKDKLCLLCVLVRSTMAVKGPLGDEAREVYREQGILCANTCAIAFEKANEIPRGLKSSRVMMLADVLLGKPVQMRDRTMMAPLPPKGHDSVHLLRTTRSGNIIDRGEFVVYTGNAIKPLFVIVF